MLTALAGAHAETVCRLVPTARVEVFRGAGHWPHLDDPDRFCAILSDCLDTTEAAVHDRDGWRALIAQGRDDAPFPSRVLAVEPGGSTVTMPEAGALGTP